MTRTTLRVSARTTIRPIASHARPRPRTAPAPRTAPPAACGWCRAALTPGADYCGRCGAAVALALAREPNPYRSAPSVPSAAHVAQPTSYEQWKQDGLRRRHQMVTWGGILLAAFIVLLLIVAVL